MGAAMYSRIPTIPWRDLVQEVGDAQSLQEFLDWDIIITRWLKKHTYIYIYIFTLILGEMIQFDDHIFQMG